jgi:hypothetical protein
MKRLAIATITGSLIMFIWGGFSHMVLFIGAGYKPLPNEEKIIKTLESSIPEKGLYFFPGKDFRQKNTGQQDSAFLEKFRTGPVGILVYRPVGGNPLSPDKLITQFISNLLSAFIAAFIVSLAAAVYWKQVFVITLIGALACVAVSTIYWNWYEFTTNFFLAQIADQTIGFFLSGLAIAKIVPQPPKSISSAF